MQLLERISGIFKAEANHAVDAAENPVLMVEQAIRDLKEKEKNAVLAEVQLKTIVIEKKTAAEKKQSEANEWGDKANKILDQAGNGIAQADADRLASEALAKQAECQKLADKFKMEADAQQKSLDGVNQKVKALKDLINQTEDHLTELKSRTTTAEVSKEVNKQLSDLDGLDNTKALLKRMEEKTEHMENEAAAYTDLQNENKSTEQEINDVLDKAAQASPASALEELKKKRAEISTAK